MLNSDLFDRARRAAKLEDYAGKIVTLRKSGSNEMRGPCPLCDPKAKAAGKFKVRLSEQDWYCFGCERHGDVVDLHAALARLEVGDAARELAGGDLTPAKPRPPKVKSENDLEREARIARMAADMWSKSRDLVGTPGLSYLVGRGIEPEVAVRAAAKIHFHPGAPHHWDERARVWATAPALIVKRVTEGGWTGGVHATYLSPDGLTKSALSPAKLMWGPQAEVTDAGKRQGGAWLIDPADDACDVILGEGIESSLGLASWLYRQGKRDFRVAAALSLGALQGGAQRDEQGCVDVWRPVGDPDRKPFLWSPCYTPLEATPKVLIAIDRDMATVTVKARSGRGRIVPMELDAEARAKLCAILACQAWRNAGWKTVTAMFPSPGGDWGDEAKSSVSV